MLRNRLGRRLLVFVVAFVVLAAVDVGWTLWTIHGIERDNPPRGVFVSLDGGRIHVQRRDPTGAPRGDVVLLHGASGNSGDVMEALGEKLAARGFRVFAPDRPGHGWSDRWPGSASPGQQAKLIRAALERLGVARPIVLGHSLAGAIADNVAIDHSDWARGVVMVSPVTHLWPGGIAWYYNIASVRALGTMFAAVIGLPAGLVVIDAAVKGVFAPQDPPPDYVRRTGAKLVLRPSESVNNAEDVAALKAFVTEQAPREAGITLPVAIIAGDATDTIVLTRIHSEASAKSISGATLKILPGVGHSPHWAAPDVIVAAVEDVFARGETRKAAALE